MTSARNVRWMFEEMAAEDRKDVLAGIEEFEAVVQANMPLGYLDALPGYTEIIEVAEMLREMGDSDGN